MMSLLHVERIPTRGLVGRYFIMFFSFICALETMRDQEEVDTEKVSVTEKDVMKCIQKDLANLLQKRC